MFRTKTVPIWNFFTGTLTTFIFSCSMFPLFALALKYFVMALAAAHAWCEHHQNLLGVRRLGGPEGFTMGDTTVTCGESF